MPEGLRLLMTLPLLMSNIPIMSLAVIAAIAVLVYEARGFLGRSNSDRSLPISSGGGLSRFSPSDELQRSSSMDADRVAALRAHATPVPNPEAAPPPVPLSAPLDEAQPLSEGDAVAIAPAPQPTDVPIVTPPRQREDGGGQEVDARLVLGAIILALALIWLAGRAIRGDGRKR